MQNILKSLKLEEVNSGACAGSQDHWLHQLNLGTINSINPATEKLIAKVCRAGNEDYEKIAQAAQTAFTQWRQVPAPRRGELIRQIGQALREHKDQLRTLVALEMGKSKQEADGEVQE